MISEGVGLNTVYQDPTPGLNPMGLDHEPQGCDLRIVDNPMGLYPWGWTPNPINPTTFRWG